LVVEPQVRESCDGSIRGYGPDQMITAGFQPNRLNVVLDSQEQVV
jgi:hypothetical protein